MTQSYVLAYDLGTSGAKCVLVSQAGGLIASATASYPLYTAPGNHAEQEPADYWRAVCATTHEVLEVSGIVPNQVAGIAFGTLWKGIIPIDRTGKVLRRSILWLDGRAGEQAKALNDHLGKRRFAATDYWPKLYWLRQHEPEIIENAEMILEVNAYLKWMATGVASVDISNSYVHSFDPEQDAFYEELFTFMDIPREKFPAYCNSWDKVGTLTQTAASQLGLVSGIPVFGGNNDIQGVSVGSGCAEIGDVHVYFGSSGWMGFAVPHNNVFTTSPFDTQRDIFMSGMKSVGLTVNWLARNLYGAEYARLGDGVFKLMDEEAAQVAAGSDGLLATPWLYGENQPQATLDCCGSFWNLRQTHTRGHMMRAMLESICFHLKYRTQYFCGLSGYQWPERVRAVGGGACSDVWMQILADVLNMPVEVPVACRHAGAIGTAYSAIVGLGYAKDLTEAAGRLELQKTYYPDPENTATYESRFAAYCKLCEIMKSLC